MSTDFIWPVLVAGDKIRRTGISYEWEGMNQGQEYVVETCTPDGYLTLEGLTRSYHSRHFVKVC